MVQFNLLPDIKIQYIKARRLKRLIATVATAIMIFSAAVAILLFVFVNLLQAKHLKDLNRDIARNSAQISNSKDLNKILTIQNQLRSLPGLHAKKPITSRLFSYLGQVTPTNVSIASTHADLTANTISLTGSADKLESVNRFVDTLKFTQFTKKNETNTPRAFSKVVLTVFGKSDKGASYTIDLAFDPFIFDGADEPKLIVPKQITTRSETEKPDALFQPITNTTNVTPSSNTTTRGN